MMGDREEKIEIDWRSRYMSAGGPQLIINESEEQ